LYSYLQAKSLKEAEAKINVGEEQLKKLLEESDIQIKYLYRLQNICIEFKQILNLLFNRNYEGTLKDNKKDKQFCFFHFNQLMSLQNFDKLNNTLPKDWENKSWNYTEKYTTSSNHEILIFLYTISKLLSWIEIKKKEEKDCLCLCNKKK
jgi:hypothetical protein